MIKLLLELIKLKKILNMKNWKTSLTGILATLPTILGWFGVPIPDEVAKSILALGVFIIGLVSKDHDKTGLPEIK